MRLIAFDTETELISPGRQFPPMACLTWAEGDRSGIMHWTDAEAWIRPLLADPDVTFVGANVAFDMGVVAAQFPNLLPLVFEAYAADRVDDVIIRQKLLDIAGGCYRGYWNSKDQWVQLNYALDALTRRLTDMPPLDKDTWRLRYGELRPSPVAEWPQGAIDYAMTDAVATLRVHEAQRDGEKHLTDRFRQARGDWFLKLGSAWGLRTDPASVEAFAQVTEAEYDRLEAELVEAGLIKVKQIGGKNPRTEKTRDTKAAKARMLSVCGWLEPNVPAEGGPLRRLALTDTDNVSLSGEACDDCEDPILKKYGEFGGLKTLMSKDLAALRLGVHYPIHTRYGLAETGRTTSGGPNIQNWRTLPGIRECFHPRAGYVYLQADVGGLELATLAQVCLDVLGESALAAAINAGLDPHMDLAALMLGWDYQRCVDTYAAGPSHPDYETVYNARQSGKVANFGFPGGLGIDSMILYAKALYGLFLTREQCMELKAAWLTKWPEMQRYFAYINAHMTNPDGTGQIMQVRSARLRGGVRYTAACNTLFQGLGADAMKDVGFCLTRACYTEHASPIFGGRPVAFVHDENIVEYPEGPGMHDAAMELERITVARVRHWLPDIPVKAPPLIMRVWSKKAVAVRDEHGRLVPWEMPA